MAFRPVLVALIALWGMVSLGVGTAWAESDTPCLQIGMFDHVDSYLGVSEAGKRVFEAAGLCTSIRIMPVRRAEQKSLSGALDGELLRSMYWAEKNADVMIPVPTPVLFETMLALSIRSQNLSLTSMDDLRGRQVVVSGGHRWAEARLQALSVTPMTTNTVSRYLELLRIGRAEVGLVEAGLLPILGDVSDMAIQPVAEIGYHIVLHRRHADLIGDLDKAVQAQGTIRTPIVLPR